MFDLILSFLHLLNRSDEANVIYSSINVAGRFWASDHKHLNHWVNTLTCPKFGMKWKWQPTLRPYC